MSSPVISLCVPMGQPVPSTPAATVTRQGTSSGRLGGTTPGWAAGVALVLRSPSSAGWAGPGAALSPQHQGCPAPPASQLHGCCILHQRRRECSWTGRDEAGVGCAPSQDHLAKAMGESRACCRGWRRSPPAPLEGHWLEPHAWLLSQSGISRDSFQADKSEGRPSGVCRRKP